MTFFVLFQALKTLHIQSKSGWQFAREVADIVFTVQYRQFSRKDKQYLKNR